MFPMNSLRMQNIFPPATRKPSGNPVVEEFISSILPLAEQMRNTDINRKVAEQDRTRKIEERTKLGEESRAREDLFDQQDFQARQGRLANIAKMVSGQEAPEPPMDVKYQPMINPYQEALLNLRQQELEQKGQLGEGRLDLSREQLEQRGQTEEGRLNLGRERIASAEKIAALRLKSAAELAAEKASLEKELLSTRGDQTMAGINRRGEIQAMLNEINNAARIKEIEARTEGQKEINTEKPVKPEAATQEKTRMQMKYNRMINEHPEWRKWVSLDENGMPTIKETGTGIKMFGNELDENTRKSILEYLGMGKPAETKKKDPLGIR